MSWKLTINNDNIIYYYIIFFRNIVIVGSEIWMLVFFSDFIYGVTMSKLDIMYSYEKRYIFAVERAKSAGKFFFILRGVPMIILPFLSFYIRKLLQTQRTF